MIKLVNVLFPLAIAIILFLMAKEAFNASFPFALPVSALLGVAGIFAVLYAMAETNENY